MVQNCVKLVDKPQLKKYFFIIYNMPNNTLFDSVIFGSYFGIAYFATVNLLKLADDYEKRCKKEISLIEKRRSQLEEEISQLKEEISQLEKEISE